MGELSSCAVQWESGVPKCVILYGQMGEQSSCAVQWESGVPKCVILDDQMREQRSIMCNPLRVRWENSGIVMMFLKFSVFLRAEPLLHLS
jgi:hypothetical protein